MILVCPSCATRFHLDESRLGGRARRVRCSRCKHEWVQAPPEEAPPTTAPEPAAPRIVQEEPPPAESPPPSFAGSETITAPPFEPERPDLREMLPPPLSANDPLAARRDHGEGHGITLGWIVLVLVVASLLAALYIGRDRVMEIWPPSAQAYEILGLAALPPGAGLAIRDVTTMASAPSDGAPAVLAVKGRVVNVSRSTRHIPPLRASLRNASGEEVRGWNFSLPRQMLAPGESADFDTRLEAPPAEALNLVVVFTPPPAR